MRRVFLAGCLLGLAVLVALPGCGNYSALRPGDTVTPRLSEPMSWTAGEAGGLGVRLFASSRESSRLRPLGFGCTARGANPVATITFFDGNEQLGSPLQVALDHRC
jgi:hypothetical protein